MRPDGPVEGLTLAQKKMADIAGIPADRPGLGAEYPKMVYKPGANPRHKLLGEMLPIGNGASISVDSLSKGVECETAFVDSPEDEAEAIEAGWFLSPDPATQKLEAAKRNEERAKDDEIERLKAQIASQSGEPEKRGPGRPPKVEAI